MERWVGRVMESRRRWSRMQSFGSGWATFDELANKRLDPITDERNSPKIGQRYGSARVAFGDLYDDVRHIEVTIHALIRDILVRRHGDGEAGWWRKGVPEAVRVKCQDRRERDADEPCDPYCYTDLLDLAKIIETQWSLFKDRFPTRYSSNRKALLDDLGRLNRIRNKVMHPVRGVAPAEDDFDFVRALGHDLAPPPSAA